MEKVLGMGGFFFRAEDPTALMRWYVDNLGITAPPQSYDTPPWRQAEGYTVFAPFPKETDFFGEKHWMLNFRVGNLDAMVKQLQANGIEVKVDAETYPNGRFASLVDLEGNPIQLWEENQ